MRWLSQKERNGIWMIKKCIPLMFSSFSFYSFAFIGILFNVILFIFVLYCEYLYYGIHIFDATTLSALLHTNFWDHFLHIFALCCALMLSSIVTTRYRFSLCFMATETFKGNSPTSLEAMLVFSPNPKEFLRFALILSLEELRSFISFFDPITQLETLEKELDGTEIKNAKYSDKNTFLVIPVLVEESCHVSQAAELSRDLLEKNFSKNFILNFSLKIFNLATRSIIIFLSFLIIHFLLGLEVFPTLVWILFIALLLRSIIGNAQLLFKAAVFNYCKELPTGPFTKEKIKSMFTKD